MRNYVEIESQQALQALLEQRNRVEHYAFQGVDFKSAETALECEFVDCIFMGCSMPEAMRRHLAPSCYLFPSMQKPFTLFPSELYSAATLYRGYDPEREESFKECYDTQVYTHYVASGKQARDIGETLARSLHDHSISDALHDLLSRYDERAVVAVMGGHALSREDGGYSEVARLAKRLTEQGKLVVSGEDLVRWRLPT